MRVLDGMLNGSLMFWLSPALLAAYRKVLLRPKLAALHGLAEAEVDALLTEITVNALWQEPPAPPVSAPDAGDTHLWALLLSEDETVLITGDALLLQNPPADRAIISSSAFFG